MKQLEELHKLVESSEAKYLGEYDNLKGETRNTESNHQDFLKNLNAQYAENVDKLTEEMDEMRTELEAQIRKLELEKEQQRENDQLKIDELSLTLEKCNQNIIALDGNKLELETKLQKKQDVEEQIGSWKAHHDTMEMNKGELQEQLESASAYIVQLEEKFYNSQTTQLDMLKQLKDTEHDIDEKEGQIETLQQYIIDLKSRIAVYIPVKGDAIDKKLAEYINNYPDRQKLKIMFLRETEGVYQFGTKRVLVKCEKDSIKIRVGGGFLSLDEFLDQYTPAELEKLERKDPLRRMTDRIAIQKTIAGRESPTASPSGRSSPNRTVSPKKPRKV